MVCSALAAPLQMLTCDLSDPTSGCDPVVSGGVSAALLLDLQISWEVLST